MSKVIYKLDFVTSSPVMSSQSPTAVGEPARSLSYIPGSALRGALAYRALNGREWRQLDQAEQARFKRLFLQGNVRYSALTPDSKQAFVPHLPVPASLWTCKDNPWPEQDNHGLVDLLANILGSEGAPADVRCPRCLANIDRVDGKFAALVAQDKIEPLDPSRRLITRTAVDPKRGAARLGQLYSLIPIEVSEALTGYMVAQDAVAADVDWLLGLFGGAANPRDRELVATAKRSSGLGRLRLKGSNLLKTADDANAQSPWIELEDAGIEERISSFNSHVREVGTDSQAGELHTYIPLTLSSDAIMLNKYLASAGQPDGDVLARYSRLLGLEGSPPNGLSLVYQAQSVRVIGGWNMLAGMPRLRHQAISLGSVWVYRVEGALTPEALQWLVSLERDGIGELTEVGYGGILVANPLHLQKWEA